MMNKLKLESTIQKRYNLFINEIIKNEVVWGLKLKNKEVWAVCPSNKYENTDVMVFWSSIEDAKMCVNEEWNDYEPTKIPLELFLKNWLVGLNNDGLLIGVNWDTDLNGLESEPIELLEDIIS